MIVEAQARQIVSLSGGKDSTAMLLLMLERGEQIDDIVFFDWGMEFPEMYEHLDKLERYIERPITRLYPKHIWDWYMFDMPRRDGTFGSGWPNPVARWCNREKCRILNRHARGDVVCIGYSYEERFSRNQATDSMKQAHVTGRFPLLEWGASETEALKYCKAKGFDWGGLYQHFSRVSCWCCPFKKPKDHATLRREFPELWARLLDMDSRSPWPWPYGKLEVTQCTS